MRCGCRQAPRHAGMRRVAANPQQSKLQISPGKCGIARVRHLHAVRRCVIQPGRFTMVHTQPRVAVSAALLAALSLGGCANFYRTAQDAPPPHAHRAPVRPPPPSARTIDALEACVREQGLVPAPPPADVAHHAASERVDQASFDGCLVRRGVALSPPPPRADGAESPGARADRHVFGEPDAADGPPGPPPYDSEFDAALQACANAEGIAAPLLELPPDMLAECLGVAGFAPSQPPPPPR